MSGTDVVLYEDMNNVQVRITPGDVGKLFVSGDKAISEKEVQLFLGVCQSARLNPFLGDAYLVKYKDSEPASIIVGKGTFLKRAFSHPRFRGLESGVIVQYKDNDITRREGKLVLKDETLLGGWARVYVDGYQVPFYTEVSIDEYEGRRYDQRSGKTVPTKMWSEKPATMINKVAIVHALREAFPDYFTGLYDSSEMGEKGDTVTIDPSDYTVTDIPTPLAPAPQQQPAPGGPNNPLLNDVARMLQEYKTRMGYRYEEAVGILESRLPFKLTDVGDNQALADAAMYEARRMLDEMESTPGIDDLAPEDIPF